MYQVIVGKRKDKIKDVDNPYEYIAKHILPELIKKYSHKENLEDEIIKAKHSSRTNVSFYFFDTPVRIDYIHEDIDFERYRDEKGFLQLYNDARQQELLQTQIYAEKKDTTQFDVQVDELALTAPYTVLIKPLEDYEYMWLAYSIGRPTNMVWGKAIQYVDFPEADQKQDIKRFSNPEKGRKYKDSEIDVEIEFGCNYKSFGILNEMLKRKKEDGYIIVSTIARDKAVIAIVRERIITAYLLGASCSIGYGLFSSQEIQDGVNEYLDPSKPITSGNLKNAAEKMAIKHIKRLNIIQFLNESIPQPVIEKICNVIERTPLLLGALAVKCRSSEECSMKGGKECEIYGKDNDIL